MNRKPQNKSELNHVLWQLFGLDELCEKHDIKSIEFALTELYINYDIKTYLENQCLAVEKLQDKEIKE